MKQLESNFEDDVTVTTIRKVTEFSVDECRSMKSSHNVKHADQDVYNGGLVEDVKIETDVNDAVVEENAIFEHVTLRWRRFQQRRQVNRIFIVFE